MIKQIVKDINFLKKKSVNATINDLYITKDLIDTLNNNKDTCIGMAANMIGYNKRIIIISLGLSYLIMINPVITNKSNLYKTKESCLSLIGERDCIRFNDIEVDYYDINFNKIHNKFSGLTAEIIEHEIDHLEGIII